jgi:hypothetical protein
MWVPGGHRVSGSLIVAGNITGSAEMLLQGDLVFADNAHVSGTLVVTGSAGSNYIELTYGATTNTNARLGNVFGVTLTGDTTFANPTNCLPGFTYMWIIRQDATGGHSASFGDMYRFLGNPGPVLAQASGSKSVVSAVYTPVGELLCSMISGSE